MFDFSSLCEFSRTHCISLCAFLVPANLIFTALTLSIVIFRLPQPKLWQSISLATALALVMILHVFTWFEVGVVAAPTFILLFLASLCLTLNFGAAYYAKSQKRIYAEIQRF